jgi:hypothetical protein
MINPSQNPKIKRIVINGYDLEGIFVYCLKVVKFLKYLENENVEIILFMTDKHSALSRRIVDLFYQFKFKFRVIYLRQQYFNLYRLSLSIYQTFQYIIKFKYKRVSFALNNVLIGDLIYDTILRNDIEIVSVEKFKLKYFRYVLVAMLDYYSIGYLLNKESPNFLITLHSVYAIFGILSRLIHSKKGIVFDFSGDRIETISTNKNVLYNYSGVDSYSIVSKLDDEHLLSLAWGKISQRVNGKDEHFDAINAYNSKKKVSIEEIKSSFGFIGSNKPFILIAPHVFSDAPHKFLNLIFTDFYEWFSFTLEKASKNQNCIFIVKEHPSSFKYFEDGKVEEIVNRLGNVANIFFLDKNYSTASLIELVDCVLTVGGTIATEFACFGVPSIITGLSKYEGAGYTIQPKNIYEYSYLIERLHKIPKLNSTQRNIAKLTFMELNDNSIIWYDSIENKIIDSKELAFNLQVAKVSQYYASSGINLDERLVSYLKSTFDIYLKE